MSKLTAKHGRDHSPRGADPVYPEQWHYVGDPGEPAFQNGWSNSGGGYGGTAFRLITGTFGPDADGNPMLRQSLEVVLAVTGGTANTTIFTLPAGYYDWANGASVGASGHDSTGVYRPWHIDGSTGDVVDGV